jgi:hypothetical protein
MTDTAPNTKAEEKPVPTTLMGYYAEDRLAASRFVKALGQATRRDFASDDQQVALTAVEGRDSSRKRTVALLKAAGAARTRALERALFAWVWRVLEQDLLALGLADELGSELRLAPTHRLADVAARKVAPLPRGSDKTAARQADATLRLLFAWAGTRDDVDPIQFARLVVGATETPKRGPRGVDRRREALRVVSGANLNLINDAMKLVACGEEQLATVESRAAEMSGALQVARQRIAKLEDDLLEARDSITGLEAATAEARAGIAALHRQLDDDALQARMALVKARGGMSNFLEVRIGQKASQAKDTLEMSPPRPEMALRLLTTLLADLDKEVECLRAPSA